MENFALYNFDIGIKTKVKYGVNLYQQIGKILLNHNFKNVLICTDQNIKKLNFFNEIVDLISKESINSSVFSEIEINPGIDTINKAKNYYKNEKFDCVIGIGGGGPIDVAKAVSIGLTHSGDIRDYIAETTGSKSEITEKVLPIISIPTTAGSGAEVSPVSVIVDERRKLKIGFFSELLFPILAIIDPILYSTLPPKATAECGLDVLSHGFDSFVSRYSHCYSETLSLKAIELVFNNLKKAVFDGQDLNARGAMAVASIFSLISMYVGKGGATHTIGEPLGGLYNVPHGYACGIAIPAMMRFLKSVCEEKYIRIYKTINNIDFSYMKKREASDDLIEDFKFFLLDLNIKRISDYVPKPDINILCDFSINHLAVDRIPRMISKEDYKTIYDEIFSKEYL